VVYPSLLRAVFLVTLGLGVFACSSSSDTGGDAAAGSAGSSATGGQAGATGASGGAAGQSSGTSLSGTLGALGAIKPTVSSLVISNSGETLVYLSSGPLTCELLTVSPWLSSAEAGSQVVEIVIKGAPKIGTMDSEVNYAEGGKSSSYEVNAKTGSVTFTKAEIKGVVEGTVMATYDDGSTLSGSFHAEFCDGGQDY
jgi:uncharacterized cupin superfamily protein